MGIGVRGAGGVTAASPSTIAGRRIAPAARAWLDRQAAAPSAVRVHAFQYAVNLIDADGDVLAVVTPAIGPGPCHLVVEDARAPLDVLVDGPFKGDGPSRFRLGRLVVEWATAVPWSPRLSWPNPALAAWPRLRPAVWAALRAAPAASLAAGVVDPSAAVGLLQTRAAHALADIAAGLRGLAQGSDRKSRQPHTTNLSFPRRREPVPPSPALRDGAARAALPNGRAQRPAVRLDARFGGHDSGWGARLAEHDSQPRKPATKEPDAFVSGARRLAGLGPGLTPAGDDALVGVLLALWWAAPALAESRGRTAVAVAAPRTNRLAAAFLRAAARGEATAVWHRLAAATDAAATDAAAVGAALTALLATGHTSGADALAGFLLALNALIPT